MFTEDTQDFSSDKPRGSSVYSTPYVIMIIWLAPWLGCTSGSRCSVLIQQDERGSMEDQVN